MGYHAVEVVLCIHTETIISYTKTCFYIKAKVLITRYMMSTFCKTSFLSRFPLWKYLTAFLIIQLNLLVLHIINLHFHLKLITFSIAFCHLMGKTKRKETNHCYKRFTCRMEKPYIQLKVPTKHDKRSYTIFLLS